MVRQLYECQACGAVYSDQETAEKCEKFCSDNNACNIAYLESSLGRIGAA